MRAKLGGMAIAATLLLSACGAPTEAPPPPSASESASVAASVVPTPSAPEADPLPTFAASVPNDADVQAIVKAAAKYAVGLPDEQRRVSFLSARNGTECVMREGTIQLSALVTSAPCRMGDSFEFPTYTYSLEALGSLYKRSGLEFTYWPLWEAYITYVYYKELDLKGMAEVKLDANLLDSPQWLLLYCKKGQVYGGLDKAGLLSEKFKTEILNKLVLSDTIYRINDAHRASYARGAAGSC